MLQIYNKCIDFKCTYIDFIKKVSPVLYFSSEKGLCLIKNTPPVFSSGVLIRLLDTLLHQSSWF
ncbi:hypothetical protein BD749_3356 [Pontibacter ramchanderi]|uniref:Uncharacterized protein n=1 Tax=Pontibacter ramchanderi TaxID=1179743 RepID=A0A2N3U9U5_9BACT|nr:hypothetical protein BD749_3356 [Pontibacter ramchanderi]